MFVIKTREIIGGKKLIKLSKVIKNLPLIMITAAIILLWINKIIPKQMNYYIEIIAILLLFAFLLDLYLDIKNKEYSTQKFIIIADVVEIISYIALFYLQYKSVDETNTELLWERAENIRLVGLIMLLAPFLKSILKSQRFKINNNF